MKIFSQWTGWAKGQIPKTMKQASQTPQKQAYTNMVNYILTKVQGQFHKERIIFFNKWCQNKQLIQKDKSEYTSHLTKINSKGIRDLNVKYSYNTCTAHLELSYIAGRKANGIATLKKFVSFLLNIYLPFHPSRPLLDIYSSELKVHIKTCI